MAILITSYASVRFNMTYGAGVICFSTQ